MSATRQLRTIANTELSGIVNVSQSQFCGGLDERGVATVTLKTGGGQQMPYDASLFRECSRRW